MKNLLFNLMITLAGCTLTDSLMASTLKHPNIVYFLCDDLGIGELGCYGQEKIKTPNIDRLARNGMLFTQHYSGSTVCAPSRCSLLTGLHTGNSYIRGNVEIGSEGQQPIPRETVTVAKLLKEQGYVTACIGKWGLGGVGTSGDPLNQGFDYFYGYNCQRHAHSYYPGYLWENSCRVELNDGHGIPGHASLASKSNPNDSESYRRFIGRDWSPDFMLSKAVDWIRASAKNKKPFFLYYATPLPHVAIQVPESRVEKYKGKLGDDKPYRCGKGYLPTFAPRAGYAAMVDKIDEDLGVLLDELRKNGLEDNTIVMFCSDNGPTFNGGTQSEFFGSARDSRGLKCDMYEGGIRVPFIVAWHGKIKPGTVSDFTSAMYDIFPTICAITGATPPKNLDGVNLLPTLTGNPANQKTHEFLYWENHEGKKATQAIRVGDWKLLRFLPQDKLELYNLADDPSESKNLAESNHEKREELKAKISTVRTDSEIFTIGSSSRRKVVFKK